MASLVLRDAHDKASAALATQGPTRQAGLVQAAHALRAAFDEAGELAELGPVAWQRLFGVLAVCIAAADRLQVELASAGSGAAAQELAQARDRLAPKVDASEWAAARAISIGSKLPRLGEPERVELAHGAITAARHTVGALRQQSADEIHRRAQVVFESLGHHVDAATDAALALSRAERRGLIAEIEALSAELGDVAAVLAMTPRAPWTRAFARTFDTEQQLRAAVGLTAVDRPYSGTVDPQAAQDAVVSAGNGDPGPGAGATAPFEDAQSAISGIKDEMRYVFERRLAAVADVGTALGEPPTPSDSSLLDVLLSFALTVVLPGVGGVIGAFVAEKVKIAAGRFMRKEIARTMTADAAKDMSKRMLQDSVTVALQSHKRDVFNARGPLNVFLQEQRDVLSQAQHDAARLVTFLEVALKQLDLETLNQLDKELRALPSHAYALQYDASLREWENLRAKLASEPLGADKSRDPNLDGPRVNNWAERPIPGVLEVGLSVTRDFGRDHFAELTYLVLRDGEVNAIDYLKRHPRKLGEAGLNRQYQMSFLGWQAERSNAHQLGSAVPTRGAEMLSLPTMVKVGVGVRDGLQRASISPDELRMLKLAASNEVTELGIVNAVLLKRYDDVPDAAALAVVKQLIADVADVTTARLEE